MAAPSSKHNKYPKAKIEMRSRLKYNIEDKMSIEQIGKGFEGNKDQIKNNIMKILIIFILMIVSTFFYVYQPCEQNKGSINQGKCPLVIDKQSF